MKKKWYLSKYTDRKQKNRIIDLRKVVFQNEDKDKENIDFWNWEFENNYAGHANIYLALVEENIVGHYAVCPSKILVNSKEKHGSIVVDVMTHPDYRHQGMFTEMGKYALYDSGKSGIDFSYGFPIRKEVMPGHLKIGWKIAFELPVYVYPLNFPAIFQKFIPGYYIPKLLGVLPQLFFSFIEHIKDKPVKKYEIRSGHRFNKSRELERFIEKTKYQHRVMQCRDYEFLEWRYHSNKYRRYQIYFAYSSEKELLGYIVLRKAVIYDLNCITVIDIQVLDFNKKVVYALLRCARKYARKCKADLIGCMMNNNSYRKYFLSNFYIKSPYIFKFIVHKNKNIEYEDLILKDKNWFLTWADTDDL